MKPSALNTTFETSFSQLVPAESNPPLGIQSTNDQPDISIDINFIVPQNNTTTQQISPTASIIIKDDKISGNSPTDTGQQGLESSSRPGSAGICKICLSRDTDATTGKMISPCACAGTMRYIHEGCLRQWIQVQDEYMLQNADEAKCELCHYKYRMTIVHATTFQWRKATSENMSSFLSCVGLLCGFIVLTVVATWSLLTLKDEDSYQLPKRNFATKIFNPNFLIGGICAILAFILLVLLISNIRDTFWSSNMVSWTIHEYQGAEVPAKAQIQQSAKPGISEQVVIQAENREESAGDISPEVSPSRKMGASGTFTNIIGKSKKKKKRSGENEKIKAQPLTESN